MKVILQFVGAKMDNFKNGQFSNFDWANLILFSFLFHESWSPCLRPPSHSQFNEVVKWAIEAEFHSISYSNIIYSLTEWRCRKLALEVPEKRCWAVSEMEGEFASMRLQFQRCNTFLRQPMFESKFKCVHQCRMGVRAALLNTFTDRDQVGVKRIWGSKEPSEPTGSTTPALNAK